MRQAIFIAAISMAVALLGSCQAGSRSTTVPANELLAITKTYLEEHHPDWMAETSLQSEITDKGGTWEVTFLLPPDMAGGTPVVLIDKASMRVVEAYHEQ